MCLTDASIEWAIDFITNHSDGDLFPKIPEMEAISAKKAEFIACTANKDLNAFPCGPCRRFIVPKDEVSYRQATQLDPQDSILLSAIVHQFGANIEARRLAADQVFSYRFNPTTHDGLYGSNTGWNDFWTKGKILSTQHSQVLYCDIADFYNQIYHHTVENQLIESSLPNQAIQWIKRLLESTTAGVSRGVPIGPHAIHLIAEVTLIPIDNSFVMNGIKFIRFADDIIIFCNDEKDAHRSLAKVASVLDKQQRLMLQKHKTKIMSSAKFQLMCTAMIEDRPINTNEEQLLAIIRQYSGGNPYISISYNQLPESVWHSISEQKVREIIESYITKDEIDYIRLRWFYRRLSQIGHPGAIEVSLQNIEKLGPCFSNICFYLASVQSVDAHKWQSIGDKLLQLLDLDEIKEQEYFRLSILSLFGRNGDINHFPTLAKLFQSSDPFVRREILLAAEVNEAFDWLREHKESFTLMDSWQKSAFIYGASGFPADEKKYFINSQDFFRPFDLVLAKWSKQ